MVTRRDYTAQAVEAAHAVLIELVQLLGAYREDIVLVGGWVPPILIGNATRPHVGSMDIDLAIDHRKVNDQGYRTIQELLLSHGYTPGRQPHVFIRTVAGPSGDIDVEVDLLAGEYGGTGKGRRHQRVQGITAHKARGCDLAFDLAAQVHLEGLLPGGGRDKVTLRVAGIVPFLIMKGMAMADRLKSKDAWDIYYCLQEYPGGLDAIVDEFRPQLAHGLVREGLEKIAAQFASERHVGPKSVADFEEVTNTEAREFIQRDVFERVHYLLSQLGIVKDQLSS